jgi:hypothetical protein
VGRVVTGALELPQPAIEKKRMPANTTTRGTWTLRRDDLTGI